MPAQCTFVSRTPIGVGRFSVAAALVLALVAGCGPEGSRTSKSDTAPALMPSPVSVQDNEESAERTSIVDEGAPAQQPTPDANAPGSAATLAPDAAARQVDEPADAERSTADAAALVARHAPDAVQVRLEPVATGLQRPIAASSLHDGSGRLLVAEKAGVLRVVPLGLRPTDSAPVFADLSGRVRDTASEQGLLGVAAHPEYATNGRVVISYSDEAGATVIAELRADLATTRADAAPEAQVTWLRVEQPASNHNGGHVAFGPEGYLWIGTGDGGRAGDPWNNAQDPSSLLGKMLRIDVGREEILAAGAASDGDPGALTPNNRYRVPPDNPFVGMVGVAAEIWAAGLRNPWRYHFDRATGDLYIGDVGQNVWEEINREPVGDPGGRNYGWRLLEADTCFEPGQDCDPRGATTRPILRYDHGGGNGCSVTGGTVYRGAAQPALWGLLFFADYCTGRVWAAAPEQAGQPDGPWRTAVVADTGRSIASFVEDDEGELYVLDDAGGAVLRVVGSVRADSP